MCHIEIYEPVYIRKLKLSTERTHLFITCAVLNLIYMYCIFNMNRKRRFILVIFIWLAINFREELKWFYYHLKGILNNSLMSIWSFYFFFKSYLDLWVTLTCRSYKLYFHINLLIPQLITIGNYLLLLYYYSLNNIILFLCYT